MAIKRSIKSRGTPLRKPAAAAAARHIDVMAKHQMVAGQLYEGWLCKSKSCGLVIAVMLAPAGSKPLSPESDDHLTAIKCPHCGDQDLYRWNARGEHRYAPANPGA